jgi:hypothetical protein
MSLLCLIGSLMFFFIKTPYIHSTRLAEMKLNAEEDYYTIDGKSMIDAGSVRLTIGMKESLRGSIRDSAKRMSSDKLINSTLGIKKSMSSS